MVKLDLLETLIEKENQRFINSSMENPLVRTTDSVGTVTAETVWLLD